MCSTGCEKIVFPVVETFVSINGEGQKSGELALFIRFKGCNLNCNYCDTKWANEAEAVCEFMTADEICQVIIDSGVLNVTLTGGEPLIQKNIKKLTDIILEKTNCNIEIETNGSVSIEKWHNHNERLSITMDYKLPDSEMEDKMFVKNFDYLMKNDTLKFVCSSISDMKRAENVIKQNNLCEKCKVYFSPVFDKIAPEQMVEYMKNNKLNKVRLQLQMHKFIWEPTKRGV